MGQKDYVRGPLQVRNDVGKKPQLPVSGLGMRTREWKRIAECHDETASSGARKEKGHTDKAWRRRRGNEGLPVSVPGGQGEQAKNGRPGTQRTASAILGT